jgi:YidC/Oxa1 family membrane protein insertase
MIVMQRVQPEIKKIQQKYKDDRQKQNEELLKFYQENKINPLAGCLPLLLILPIGIAVFGTFRHPGIQAHIPRTGPFNALYKDLCTEPGQHKAVTITVTNPDTRAKSIVALAQPPKGTVLTPTRPNGSTVESCTDLLTVHTPAQMHFLGLVLNLSARDAIQRGWGYAIPWLIVLVIVVVTGWYQVRQTQARQLKQGNSPVNQQMQMVTRIMPVFFGLISFSLNAATTLYFSMSNLWRIGQQHFVLNNLYEEEAAKARGGRPKVSNGDAADASAPPDGKPPAGRRAGGGAGGGAGNGAGGTPTRPSPHAARRKKKRKR